MAVIGEPNSVEILGRRATSPIADTDTSSNVFSLPGSEDYDSQPPEPSDSEPGLLRSLTLGSISKATSPFRRVFSSKSSDYEGRIETKTVPVEIGGYEILTLRSGPHPDHVDDRRGAPVTFLEHGWQENPVIAFGSARMRHNAHVLAHPDRWTVSFVNDGYHEPLSFRDALDRDFPKIARGWLNAGASIAGDAPSDLATLSMGGSLATEMCWQNLNSIGGGHLNIQGLRMVSPAIVARDAPEGLWSREIPEEELSSTMTPEFLLRHMPSEVVRELQEHPLETIMAGIAIMRGVAWPPHRAPQKTTAIYGNLKSLQQGIDYEKLETVFGNIPSGVVTGSLDTFSEIPMYEYFEERFPGFFTLKVIEGKGHLLCFDNEGTAKVLRQIQLAQLALKV